MIRIDMAKSSLVRRNETEYLANLRSAKNWLINHFDSRADNVKTVLKTINQLMKIRLNSQLPDISQSLKMLRDVTKFRLGSELKDQPDSINTAKQTTGQKKLQDTNTNQPEKTGATQ